MAQFTVYRHKLTCPHCSKVLMSGLGQVVFEDILPQSFACRFCGGTIVTASPEAYAARKKYNQLNKEHNELLAKERRKWLWPVYLGVFLFLFTAVYLFISKSGSRSLKPTAWLVIFISSLVISFVASFLIAAQLSTRKLRPQLKEMDDEMTSLRKQMYSDRRK